MKSANFVFELINQKIYGTVTLKDDGKISVTDMYGHMCGSDKDRAKSYAKSIVEKDFPTDMCTNFKTTENSKHIELVLLENTVEFKNEFIEKTKEFCIKHFNLCVKDLAKTEEQRYIDFGITYEIVKDVVKPFPSKENSALIQKYFEVRYKQRNIIKLGLEAYTEQNIKDAEQHYHSSIKKLAYKLYEKGIVGVDFEIISGKVKNNFECEIHHNRVDGKYTKITRAWTIIAEGPIQAPHYRYLIK